MSVVGRSACSAYTSNLLSKLGINKSRDILADVLVLVLGGPVCERRDFCQKGFFFFLTRAFRLESSTEMLRLLL